MATFSTVDELIRILDSDPELLEALQARLLTRRLLNLPQEFDEHRKEFKGLRQEFDEHREEFNEFKAETNARFDGIDASIGSLRGETTSLREDVSSLQGDVTSLRGDVSSLQGDVTSLREDVNDLQVKTGRLITDMGHLKGSHAHTAAIQSAPVISEIMGFKWVRTLSELEIYRMAHSEQTSKIGAERRRRLQSFRSSDIIMEALNENGETCYVAVEVSYTIRQNDIARAVDHKNIAAALTGAPTYAAVAGYYQDDGIKPDGAPADEWAEWTLAQPETADATERVFCYPMPRKTLQADL